MDATETDTQGALPSLRDATTALGLRPAIVKQDILRGQPSAVRVPRAPPLASSSPLPHWSVIAAPPSAAK